MVKIGISQQITFKGFTCDQASKYRVCFCVGVWDSDRLIKAENTSITRGQANTKDQGSNSYFSPHIVKEQNTTTEFNLQVDIHENKYLAQACN